jgi:DNA repair protein RadC
MKELIAKVCEQGAATLSDAELIGTLAGGDATRGYAVMAAFGGKVAQVLALDPKAAGKVAKAPVAGLARIACVMELARRSLLEEAKRQDSLTSPAAVRGYLRLQMQTLQHECFWVIALDAQNRVIDARELFRGTLTQTSVYPREVVKYALSVNAAALILAHNHPSGVAEPSVQDQALTRTLAEALALVDVKVLDHFIVAPGACLSFAERGLI